MKIAYENENVQLWHGDCREWSGNADAVVSDPPYGMDWNFSGGGTGKNAQGGQFTRFQNMTIEGDKEDFDPTRWLGFPHVVLWGFHHFPQHLERGSVLVWVKKYANAWGTFLSDADLAWMKGGCGVYLSKTINPAKFQSEREHPTQKPVELMAWCMDKAKVPEGETVLDPYAGSGTTLIAALETGRKAIGIEIDERWVEVARRRLERWHAQGRLDFGTANAKDEVPK